MPLRHGPHEDADALIGTQSVEIIPHPDHGGFIAHGYLAAVGRQVVGDRILDDPQQLLLGIGGANGESMQKLDHETGEALEGARNADGRVDLDQDPFGGMDVDLEFASLVDGRVEESEETLSDKRKIVKSQSGGHLLGG